MQIILQKSHNITIDLYNNWIKCVIIKNLYDAEHYINLPYSFCKSGSKPNTETYTVIIESLWNNNPSEVIEFFKIIPDEFKCPRQHFLLIAAMLISDDLLSASNHLLFSYNVEDYHISNLVLNTVLNRTEFDQKSFSNCIKYMDQFSIKSDGHFFTILRILTKFHVSGNQMNRLLSDMEKYGMNIDHAIKNCKLMTLISQKQLKNASDYLKTLIAVLPDFMVRSCVYDGLIELALETGNNGVLSVNVMRRREERFAARNSLFLKSMSAFSSTNNFKKCLSYIKQVTRNGIRVTSDHYFHLINAYCNFGSVKEARRCLKGMISTYNIRPSVQIYNRLIKAFLDQREKDKPQPNFRKAFKYLCEMVKGIKLSPNNETLDHFCSALDHLKNDYEKWFAITEVWYNIFKIIGTKD